jgi:hypothetical protein
MRFGSWYLGIRDFGGGGPYGPSPFAEKYNFPTPIWMRSASAGALGRWGADQHEQHEQPLDDRGKSEGPSQNIDCCV